MASKSKLVVWVVLWLGSGAKMGIQFHANTKVGGGSYWLALMLGKGERGWLEICLELKHEKWSLSLIIKPPDLKKILA